MEENNSPRKTRSGKILGSATLAGVVCAKEAPVWRCQRYSQDEDDVSHTGYFKRQEDIMETGTVLPMASDMNANVKCWSEQQKMHCPELPEGWTREERLRQSGATAGRVDVYFKSPDGKTFKSKGQLNRVLGDQFDFSMVRFSFKPSNMLDKGPDNYVKCHKACKTACFKLPESFYKLPGEILSKLTASPLDTLQKLNITAAITKSRHIKLLFQCLAKATALKDIEVHGHFGSVSFSEAANYMSLVLSRCIEIKLKQFNETPNFWKKCMASVKSNCQEFSVIECNCLEIVVFMLPRLLPKLICLEISNPNSEGFRQVREKKLFLKFFKEKVSQKSVLEFMVLDKLEGLLLDVPPEILFPALSSLKIFSICRTSLYLPHLLPLVKSWAELSPESLSVESSWGCWNQLSSDLLVPTLTNISSVSFKGVQVCGVVLVSLLSAVAGGCAIKELDLRGNDMSRVSPDIMVAAILNLRVAVFTKCEMDEEAVMKVLRRLADRDDYRGELEELHLTGDNEEEEEKLVKLVKEQAGITCLEICPRDCKCEDYCTWRE